MLSKPHDILLVEDHADSASVLARLLNSFGHFVQIARSCAEARRLFDADPDIDVMLIDLGLPDGDGCDLLRELAAKRSFPAIAVTGHGMAADVQRSRAAGFIAHITKPLLMPELKEVLATIRIESPAGGPSRQNSQQMQ
jgi:CheY-like chemotaxis protein